MAFKFADEEYETYLNDIEWTMGRTGVLTPVAIFEPVDTGDSVIERASLHNVSIMKDLLWRPYKGQSLMVCKMNDIIPQVVSAGREISPADFEGLEFTIPIECPICGGRLEVVCEVDTEVLICTNDACEGKLVNRLDHFCGKKGLDIKGLSKATLGKLVDWGWIKEPADLYNLNKRLQVWANIPGFGIKSVNNILNAIDNSKNPKLESFICALGIPHVGKTLSAQLAKEFKNYEEFREAVTEKWDFTQLDGVAYEKASAIWNFDFTEADHVAEHMLGYEVTGGPSSNILEGESICITGRLTQHKNRDELVKRITDRGGKVVSGVSKNTTWLINNDVNSTSSKNVTAQRLGIPIITEEEFINQFLSMEI
jgi:DNA ligase (NAD+)